MKESRCEKCGEITARYPDGGGIVMSPSGHYCKGTVERAERDLVRVIGWLMFNELKVRGQTQQFTGRLAALERLYQSELQDEHDMPHFQRTVDPVWMILKELEAMEK